MGEQGWGGGGKVYALEVVCVSVDHKGSLPDFHTLIGRLRAEKGFLILQNFRERWSTLWGPQKRDRKNEQKGCSRVVRNLADFETTYCSFPTNPR